MLSSSRLPFLSRRNSLVARLTGFVGVGLLGIVIATQSGCLGLMSNFMHAVGADRVPAECELLEDSKIAVVTMTDRSQYSDDIVARLLTRKLSDLLLSKVKNVTLIREDKVQQWRDTHGWDNLDYLEIGKSVGAEKVLAIELTGLKLREGATLYRGQAAVVTAVYDVATEELVFRKEIDEFMFPTTAGQYTSETTEPKFRKLFLSMLAERIGRIFHPYDFADTIALDGAIASQ